MPTPAQKEPQLPVPTPTPTTHSRRGSIPAGGPKPQVWGPEGSGSYESGLRQEMNLVAEAAKRASVAIVVRDLKECSV